jgi:hypothetical protein
VSLRPCEEPFPQANKGQSDAPPLNMASMPSLSLNPIPVTRKPEARTRERADRAALLPFDRVSGVWRKCQKLSRSVQAPSCDLQPCQPRPAPDGRICRKFNILLSIESTRLISKTDGFRIGEKKDSHSQEKTLGGVWLTNLKRFQP